MTYGFNQNADVVATLPSSPLNNFCASAKHNSSPNTYSIDSASLISSGSGCSGAGGSVQTASVSPTQSAAEASEVCGEQEPPAGQQEKCWNICNSNISSVSRTGGIVIRDTGQCLPSDQGMYTACNVAFHQGTACQAMASGTTWGHIVVSDLEHLQRCATRMDSMAHSEYNDRHVESTDLMYNTGAPIKASLLCGADDD